jgi:hypothetical protein
VPRHKCGESGLAAGVTPGVEALQELLVGEPDHGVALEERADLLGHSPFRQMRHQSKSPESVVRARGVDLSTHKILSRHAPAYPG